MQPATPLNSVEELQKYIKNSYKKNYLKNIIRISGKDATRIIPHLKQLNLSDIPELLVIHGTEFEEHAIPLEINGEDICTHVVFINCILPTIKIENTNCNNIIFIDTILQNLLISKKTAIKNMLFKQSQVASLIIQESQVHNLSSKDNTTIRHICFVNATIENIIYIGSYLPAKMLISASAINSIKVNGVFESIIISKKTTIDEIELSNLSNDGHLHCHHLLVKDASAIGALYIEHFNCCGIFLRENSDIKQLHATGFTLGILDIYQSKVQNVSLNNLNTRLHLENATIGSFNSNASCLQYIKCNGDIAGKYYFDAGEIGELVFQQATLTKESSFSLARLSMGVISFDQLLVSGLLQFKETHGVGQTRKLILGDKDFPFESMEGIPSLVLAGMTDMDFSMYNLTNNGTLLVGTKKIEHTPQLIICRSSLGKTEFIGCDLSAFQFTYRNSKLLEIFFAGTNLPTKDNRIEVSPAEKTDKRLDRYEQKINVYSQLKKIFDSQGNITEGNLYHSRAMHYQQKLLSRRFESAWKTRHGIHIFCDLLAFRLNRLSNNHGESWGRALFFTAIVTVLFFALSTWSLKYHLVPSNIFKQDGWKWIVDYSNFWSNREKIPAFFLPTHKMELLTEGTNLQPGFWHYCWDVAGRIFIGYGIYQFISAFRRHNRKPS